MLDFGLAKVTSEGQEDGGLTREGQMLGTPDFIAPEQIRDAKSADIRADIYSLGCTLYYLLTGKPPFKGENLWDLYQAHFSNAAAPLNLVRPEVPAELAALVTKMMAKDPECRFHEPKHVVQALLPFVKPGVARSPALPDERPRGQSNIAASQAARIGAEEVQPSILRKSPVRPAVWSQATTPDGAPPERLIETLEGDPGIAVARPEAADTESAPARRPTWLWPSVAVAALCLAVIFVSTSGIFGVATIGPEKTKSLTLQPLGPDPSSVARNDKANIEVAPVALNTPDQVSPGPTASSAEPSISTKPDPPEPVTIDVDSVKATEAVAQNDPEKLARDDDVENSGKQELSPIATRPDEPLPIAKRPQVVDADKRATGPRAKAALRLRANAARPIVGKWKHTAQAPNANNSEVFRFWPDGSIHGPKGALRGSWSFQGSILVLRWPSKKAPGGALG